MEKKIVCFFFQKSVQGQMDIHMQNNNNNLEPYLTQYGKIYSKLMKDSNVIANTIKLLEDR